MSGVGMVEEMREFASFSPGTQRYVRRSLDVAFGHRDAMDWWARDVVEQASIRAQRGIYERLSEARRGIPVEAGLGGSERFLSLVMGPAGFDLSQGRIETFSQFRFLYERLVGARARPWLLSAFCAAAALPHLSPGMRGGLLRSISEKAATAPGWSAREPAFVPFWIDKVDGLPV